MALHRDIFWVGRQWAVTGHGMQLIDQRLKGAFDIEASRLWDDDLIESLRAKEWLKAEDFDKGLAVARKRLSAAVGRGGAGAGNGAGSSAQSRSRRLRRPRSRKRRSLKRRSPNGPLPSQPAASSRTAGAREPAACCHRAAKAGIAGLADENRWRRQIRAPLARLDEENMRKSAGFASAAIAG